VRPQIGAFLLITVIACGARSDLGDPLVHDAQADDAARGDATTDSPIDASIDAPAIEGGSDGFGVDGFEFDAGLDAAIPDGGPPLNWITYSNQRGCVVQKNGNVKCWGRALLGNGLSNDSASALSITGLGIPAIKVAMTAYVTCARLQDDSAWCWGSSPDGMLGSQNATYLSPVAMMALGNTVVDISVGTHHGCAVVLSGGVKCWGAGSDGELGNNQTSASIAPVDVIGLADKAVAVSVGGVFGCALLATGAVQCWGQNNSGQLGDGTETTSWTATKPVPGIMNAVALATGGAHTCVLTGAGGVKCWGDDAYGELGDNFYDGGSDPVSLVPVDVVGLSSGVTAITAYGFSTCAVLSNGSLKCWGRNLYGSLGDGTTIDRHTPVDVVGLQSNVINASLGSTAGCALMSNGGAKCWGDLAIIADAGTPKPVDVPGLP
jgi:alpha-tubulin suppressor-like RCC1 family protein